MKIARMIAAASLVVASLGASTVAEARDHGRGYGYDHRDDRGRGYDRRDYRHDNGNHHGWRNGRGNHRCFTQWRHHHAVRVCR